MADPNADNPTNSPKFQKVIFGTQADGTVTGVLVDSDGKLEVTGNLTANIEGDYVDDSAFAVGTDRGLITGGVVTTDTIDSGDYGAFKINTKRELYVVQDVAGNLNVTEANSAAIEALLTTIDIDTGYLVGALGIDGVAGPAFAFSIGGTETGGKFQEIRVDSDGHLQIDALTLPDVTQSTASNLNAQVVGDVADNAADSGNSVKIGSVTTDYEPDTEDEQGVAESTAGDRMPIAMNLRGEIITGVNPYFFTLDNISTTYNNVTTTATSTGKECWNYRQATISFELTESGAATNIIIEVEVSLDGTNYTKLMNGGLGAWIYDDGVISSAGTLKRSYTFPIAAQLIRVKVTATGTSATNTFTMANAMLYMRN